MFLKNYMLKINISQFIINTIYSNKILLYRGRFDSKFRYYYDNVVQDENSSYFHYPIFSTRFDYESVQNHLEYEYNE